MNNTNPILTRLFKILTVSSFAMATYNTTQSIEQRNKEELIKKAAEELKQPNFKVSNETQDKLNQLVENFESLKKNIEDLKNKSSVDLEELNKKTDESLNLKNQIIEEIRKLSGGGSDYTNNTLNSSGDNNLLNYLAEKVNEFTNFHSSLDLNSQIAVLNILAFFIIILSLFLFLSFFFW